MFVRFALCGALAAAMSAPLLAQSVTDGYLCCNLRTDGSWISDINYIEAGKQLIPVGTPVKATGYGRYRVYVEIDGKKQAIGNDYSRELNMDAFTQRYIVTEDPQSKLAGFPEEIRNAIKSARLTPGMTREQVVMAVGYPVTSENPNFEAKIWRYWLNSDSEFQVVFDDKGRVQEIAAFSPYTRSNVLMD